MYKPMFERDILYPTQNAFEPGSAHITVYNPRSDGQLPIIISGKTDHNPSDYKYDIAGILQTDIFDRIRINIKEIGILYFVSTNKEKPVVKVKFLANGEASVEEIQNDNIEADFY